MSEKLDYSIRQVGHVDAADRTFLLDLFERTPSVGFPSWFSPDLLASRQRETATDLIGRLDAAPVPGVLAVDCLLIAEAATGERLGFVWATRAIDHFTRLPVAHVEDLTVAPHAEGRGIGTALLAAAEHWARSQGFEALTLNVWPDNARALALYAHRGFSTEMLRMKKLITRPEDPTATG